MKGLLSLVSDATIRDVEDDPPQKLQISSWNATRRPGVPADPGSEQL